MFIEIKGKSNRLASHISFSRPSLSDLFVFMFIICMLSYKKIPLNLCFLSRRNDKETNTSFKFFNNIMYN